MACRSICAICFGEIDPAEEAFINDCFHHFDFDCIVQWIKNEQERGTKKLPSCPMCRREFSSIIYDCHDISFKEWNIDGSSATATGDQPTSLPSSSFALTSALRRRRSVYYDDRAVIDDRKEGHDTIQQQNDTLVTHAEAMHSTLRQPTAFITMALLDRSAIFPWLQRELQAVLLQRDVDLIAHHIVGSLRNAFREVSSSHTKTSLHRARMSADIAINVVTHVSEQFVPDRYRSTFADEFVRFVASDFRV